MGPSGTTSPQRPGGRPVPEGVLAALLGVAALAAGATLLFQIGQLETTAAFSRPGGWSGLILWVQAGVLALFAADRVLRLLAAPDRAAHLGANWFDLALPAGAALLAAATPAWRSGAMAVGALYVLITQAYTASAALVRRAAEHSRRTGRGWPVAWLLLGGMAALCLAGSLLLALPAAVSEDAYFSWDYGDAAFTAISAVTCTGLILKPTAAHFTFFGQVVLLLLIQAGALAILFAGTTLVRLASRALATRGPESALAPGPGVPTVPFVLTATLACEALGALALYPMFAAVHSDGSALTGLQAAWYSIFHAASAFCNAGFCLYPRGLMQGLNEGWTPPLRDAWQVYGIIAPLIVLGGLGMSVLGELANVPARLLRGRPRAAMSDHARLVLVTTVVMIVVGAGVLLAIESAPRGASPEKLSHWVDEADRPGTGPRVIPGERKLYALPLGQRTGQAVFESISARSAGFSTVDPGAMTPGSTLWLCGLMTVGGAPGGAAGGIKVTVLAVLVLAAWGALRGRAPRGISLNVLARAVTVLLAYAALVGTVAILLGLATGWDSRFFLKILVEACSACGNVGISLEVSERLGRGMTLAKCALGAGMLLGKAGLAALALAMASGAQAAPDEADIIV